MFEIIGYIARNGSNKKNLPNGFKESDFEQAKPVIYLEGKLNGVFKEQLVIRDIENKNDFRILTKYVFQIKKGIEYKIDEENNIVISGYFEIEHNSSTKVTDIKPIENIEELKTKPSFFKNQISRTLKIREYREKLKWYKQKGEHGLSEIFSIISTKKKETVFDISERVLFYDENLVEKSVFVDSVEELLKKSKPYDFKEL